MSRRPSVIKGDNNILINGDNNVVNTITIDGHRVLTKTQIYDILVLFTESYPSGPAGVNTSDPAPITEKLVFNRAHKYNILLRGQILNYESLNLILESVPKSELIVDSLHWIYLNSVEIDQTNGDIIVEGGDDKLDVIRETITQRILNHKGRDVDSYSLEQIEAFVLALMLYGIWKCKILANPRSSGGDGRGVIRSNDPSRHQ